ncbi:MAG: hypothetical protein ABJL54_18890 [Halioglobus sp.]
MPAKIVAKAIVAAAIALTVGCATSHQPVSNEVAQIEAINSEAVAHSQPVTSIAVFMVTEDQQGRVEFEDSFSASMNSSGISASPTYTQLPGVDALEGKQVITNLSQQAGADSAMTIEMIEEQSKAAVKTTKATGIAFWTALILDQPEIADISGIANMAAYDKARRYKLRLTLWDANSGSKIWSMDTQSATTFGVIAKDARVLAEVVSEELRNKGLAS